MKKVSIEINGHVLTGVAVYSKGALWVHLNGETFSYEPPGSQSRNRAKKGGGGLHSGEVMAPMPGKIVKIFASEGEAVTEGQVLLVMEAMKMEYTLKAHGPGKVAAVSVKPGDQVGLGQVLVKLETEKANG